MSKEKTPTDLIEQIVNSSTDCDVAMMNKLIETSKATTKLLESIRDLKAIEEDIIDETDNDTGTYY